MSPVRLSGFRRSVAEAMKTLGQPRPGLREDPPRSPSGNRSEAAVRERLYGKRGQRP
jgi:hypothetical protein